MSQTVEIALQDCPFPAKTGAKRIIRFCVPDEWYRRSKSRSLSLTPIEGGGTFQSNSSETNSDEETGTAKQRTKASGSSAMRQDTTQEFRQSGRFSLFEGWGTITSPYSGATALAHASPGDRSTISVSAPLAVLSPQQTGLGVSFDQELDLSEDVVSAEFERMMVSLSLSKCSTPT